MKPIRPRGFVHAAAAALLAALTLGAAAPPARAQAIPVSTKYDSQCSGCHGSPLATTQPGTGAILTWSALNVTGTSAQIAAAMRDTSRLTTGLAMHDSYSGIITGLSDADLNEIYAYLRGTRDTVTTTAVSGFGSTDIGATGASRNVTIANLRGESLPYSFVLQGTNPGDFQVTQSPAGCVVSASSGSVAAAIDDATPSSCTLQVRFQPLAAGGAGTRQAQLKITFTGGASPTPTTPAVDLAGTAVAPFQISATTLDFGSVTVGTTPTPLRSAIISNVGITTGFTITGLTLNAAAIAAHYAIAPSNGCTIGLAMPVGAPPCQLDVNYAPTVAVASTPGATLSVAYSGATGSPQVITLSGSATPAPQGTIQLSAASLSFADTQLGANSTQSITVHNSGDAALNFGSFALSGSAASDYERTGSCSTGTPLQVGPASDPSTSCMLIVTFRPTALGIRSASLTIHSDATNDPVSISLAGTGVPVPAPQVTLSPPALAFGSQTLGGLYPKRTITLMNSGTADLAVAAIAVEGTGFASASVCPASLAPGAGCAIDIGFTPVAADTDYTGSLRVTSNAAGSPHTAALTGHGTATTVPVLLWSPAVSRLDFGPVSAGTVSAAQSLMLFNQGPGGVNLTVLNALGADAAAFSVTAGSCVIGTPLFEGQTCTIDVRFAPASAGDKSASLQVASTGSAPPTLTLAGTGLGGPAPALSVSATALNFDPTRVGAQSLPAELTLSGTGAGGVQITGIAVTGPYAVQSKTCPGLPFTLPAGGTCTVTVTFQPQAEGDASGVLRVTSDASPTVRELALGGKGVPAADVSSGGCSLARGDSMFDPSLWALAILALAALRYRHRARGERPPRTGRDRRDPR